MSAVAEQTSWATEREESGLKGLRVAENLMIQLGTENKHELLFRLTQGGEITVLAMQLPHARDRVGDKILQPPVRDRRTPRPEIDVGNRSIHEVGLSHP